MVALAALPSASVALVVTRSASLGIANGIAVSVGIVLGDVLFLMLALLGLSVLAQTMGSLFMLIKYLGAAYLIWLGYTLLKSKSPDKFQIKVKEEKRHLLAGFFAGFILTLGDMKAMLFYASLLPVFIDLSALKVADILVVVSVTIIGVGGVKLLYAFSSTRLASLASTNKLDISVRNTAGGLMVGAGSYLIIKA